MNLRGRTQQGSEFGGVLPGETYVVTPSHFVICARVFDKLEAEKSSGIKAQIGATERAMAFTAYGVSVRVYFLACMSAGLVKIGKTKNLEQRIKTLMTMSPVPLTLLAAPICHPLAEMAVHQMLAEHRSHGEWFRMAEPVLDVIDAAQESNYAMAKAYVDAAESIMYK
jgi:hypothetical protein